MGLKLPFLGKKKSEETEAATAEEAPKAAGAKETKSKFGGLFKRTADIFGFDLSNENAKLFHASESDGKLVIKEAVMAACQPDAVETIAEFVRENALAMKAKNKKVVCILPSRHFISRNIDMPSNNPDEIAKIINLQLGRFTPYSRDEIVVDYTCREMEGMHYTNVLLIIVHRKVIQRYYDIMALAGMTIEKIIIGSEALAKAVSEEAGGETTASVHVGEDTADVTIVDNGQMAFVRSIAIGAKALSADPEKSLREFVTELNKSLSAYADEGIGQPVKAIVLSGATAEAASLEAAIQSGVTAVGDGAVVLKTVKRHESMDLPDSVTSVLEAHPNTSFIEGMLGLRHYADLKLDLIPGDVRIRKAMHEGGRDVVNTGILIMTIFLMVGLMLSLKIYYKGVDIHKLDGVNFETFDQARALERVSTKTRAVRKLIENRGRGLYVFDKVTALIGDDIYLTEFKYDMEGSLSIAGTAESMSRIFAFVTTLEESNYFSSVKTNETQSRRQGKKEVADFQIDCVLAEGF